MTPRLVNVDRETPLLMSPDLREWVPEDDMVHFVLEAVGGMRLSTLTVNRRGSGSEQYPPKMMLALLIYCYANGIFGSRRIERATYLHVAVRYLTADTHPDHDTICKFRRENFDAVAQAFLEVLKLARQMGVLKVGTVSVDGTHIGANASKDRNVRYDRPPEVGELDRQLQRDIAELMKKAQEADQNATDDGQRLPDEIQRRQKLREKMQQARAHLQTQAKARAAAEREEYERKKAQHDQRPAGKRGPSPRPPGPDADQPRDDEQVNLTDADSKLMRKSKRSGYTQSYNAQAAVDAGSTSEAGSMLILAGHVTACASDAHELIPAVAAVPPEAGQVTAVLADSGYVDSGDIEQLQRDGLDIYVAVSREENHDQRRYDFRPPAVTDPASGGKPAKVVTHPTLLAMKQKLQTPQGKRTYAKRKQTVEPVFGIIKSAMGFRQFLLRGIEKVSGEWSLVRLAYNVKRLWALQPAA